MLILRLPAPFLGLACANSEQQKPKPREIWPKAKADNRAVTPSPAPCLSRWKVDSKQIVGGRNGCQPPRSQQDFALLFLPSLETNSVRSPGTLEARVRCGGDRSR